jgi:hypothetical protein
MYDPTELLIRVDAHRAAVLRDEGRRVRRGTALCELVAEAIKTKAERGDSGFQAKHRRYQSLFASYQEEHSPAAARRKALMRVEGEHLRKLERILSYCITGQRGRK